MPLRFRFDDPHKNTFEAYVMLIAVGLAVLTGITLVHFLFCKTTKQEAKLHALRHPDEVGRAMEDMGLI